jgi:hypothetical protein
MTKPSDKIVARVIALGKKRLGNKQIEALVPGIRANQIAGILHRAGIKRKQTVSDEAGSGAKMVENVNVTPPAQPTPELQEKEEAAVVYWLRFYKRLGLVTRAEVGVLLGKTDAELADICDRYDIVPWPKVSDQIKRKRTCCFPLTARGDIKTLLCCAPTDPEDGFVCKVHAESKIPLG